MKINKLFLLCLLLSFSCLWSVRMVRVRGAILTRGETIKKSDLYPVHKVKVKSFYISKYEITQKQWNQIMDSADCPVKGDDYPVSNVSWWDAVKFCNKLSRKERLTPCYDLLKGQMVKCNYNASGYRLPSEAEWELAAIGGGDRYRKNFAGDDFLIKVGWTGIKSPRPVGQKKPNRLGIYDMTGNVSEWCNDWYDLYYYRLSKLQPDNPKGANYGNYKSLRGGSYLSGAKEAKVPYRSFARPVRRKPSVGFRVVKSF